MNVDLMTVGHSKIDLQTIPSPLIEEISATTLPLPIITCIYISGVCGIPFIHASNISLQRTFVFLCVGHLLALSDCIWMNDLIGCHLHFCWFLAAFRSCEYLIYSVSVFVGQNSLMLGPAQRLHWVMTLKQNQTFIGHILLPSLLVRYLTI